ncbi:MAG TPA: sugar phosphate isomerase/epimerase family protein [Candidatus Saccharimonadales bacterium]|nr:sugar phosphate isomerase/epimerase family protein [Candidatus Saccharimonadales bacterium]
MNVNVSIGDFSPLLRSPGYLFRGLQQTGVDGIELWLGVKSRWTPEHYLRLSKKYGLPIVSVHQPLWAMTGLYFDEGFFTVAQRLGVQYVTCHPLPGRYLAEVQMDEYGARLARLQEHTGIRVLIENMPQQNRSKLLNLIAPLEGKAAPIADIYEYATRYGLGLTLDTDHLHVARPQDEPWFDTVFPAIQNIHLSSFAGNERHLPLDVGDLDTAGLLRRLKEKHYEGLITLEVSAPKGVTILHYDFDCIRRLVELVP